MGVRARPMAWWELASVSRADRITEGAAKATGARRVYAETCISARASMASGDLSSAITALEPISAESPSAIDAHRLLGIALLESGEAARARRPFEVALEADWTGRGRGSYGRACSRIPGVASGLGA
jgi:Flp pilus assembly protein TadD